MKTLQQHRRQATESFKRDLVKEVIPNLISYAINNDQSTRFGNYNTTYLRENVPDIVELLVNEITRKISDFSNYYEIVWRQYEGCKSSFGIVKK